jgi:transportin-3
MLRVVQGFGEDLPSSCKNTAEDVWGVLDGLLQRQGAVPLLAERTCSILRVGLEFFGLATKPVVPSLLEQLSSSFETTGFASYVWIVGKTVRLFGNEEGAELRRAFRSAFERVSQQVFGLLKIQTPDDVPDGACFAVEPIVIILILSQLWKTTCTTWS